MSCNTPFSFAQACASEFTVFGSLTSPRLPFVNEEFLLSGKAPSSFQKSLAVFLQVCFLSSNSKFRFCFFLSFGERKIVVFLFKENGEKKKFSILKRTSFLFLENKGSSFSHLGKKHLPFQKIAGIRKPFKNLHFGK